MIQILKIKPETPLTQCRYINTNFIVQMLVVNLANFGKGASFAKTGWGIRICLKDENAFNCGHFETEKAAEQALEECIGTLVTGIPVFDMASHFAHWPQIGSEE